MIKISVVIPVYNCEKYIKECVQSVIEQTLKEIEIIIVDDGSTDKTPLILEEMSKKDNRIKVIRQNNNGVLAARGIGYKQSVGEYILSLDGDDWIENYCCEKMYNQIKKTDSDMAICCFYSEYKNSTIESTNTDFIGVVSRDEYASLYLQGKINSYLWTRLFKNNLIDGIEFDKKISFGDDTYINICMLKNLKKIVKVDEHLVHYRVRKNSITKKYDQSILEISNIIDFIKDSNSDICNNYQSEFELFIYNHIFKSRLLDRMDMRYRVHKQLYITYKTTGIDIENNKYYIENISNKHKFMTKFYNFGYDLGYIVTYLVNKLVYYTRVKGRLEYQD